MTEKTQGIENALTRFIQLFLDQNYDAFTSVLDTLTPEQAKRFLGDIVRLFEKRGRPVEYMAAVRRMATHPKVRPYLPVQPYLYNQSVIFFNREDLKTRVALSFFGHDSLKKLEIDYGYEVWDSEGRLCLQGEGRLLPMQTANFDVSELLLKNQMAHVKLGTFRVRTAHQDLMSLRIYAQWYNDVGMCTTHEKGALANASDLAIYPTIVVQKNIETYFLVAGTSPEHPVTVEAFLFRDDGTMHNDAAKFTVPAQGAVQIPVSQCFRDIENFLQGRPGVAHLHLNPPGRGMYYYAIQDKVKNAWQIQHT